METYEEELIKLFDTIYLQIIFNAKKTKINLQADYEIIIHIINKLKENEFELFFIYLNEIKISLFKIIVNGFIEFNFNDENKEKNILDIISRMIGLFYNKNFFYFIYKKLSKYYRKRYKRDNIDSIKKFERVLHVWKLLYNPLIIKSFYDSNYYFITFFSRPNANCRNIKIDLVNKGNLIITIKFLPFPILDINKYNSNFYFFTFYNDDNEKAYIKYEDLFFGDNYSDINCLSKINEIKFTFIQKKCNIF